MSDWDWFNRVHKDSGAVVDIEDKKMYEWKCSCGARNLMRLNSGIPLGLKIQWRAHFEEVIKRKKEKVK